MERPGVRRCHRTPADGVHERPEGRRVVEQGRVEGGRQALVRQQGVADFKLPDDGQLVAESVFVKGLERHLMLQFGDAFVGR